MPAPIDVSFRADLSNLTKQLAKMPEVTEKEAKAMVKALEKQFKSAEKAAERAAKKAGEAWKKQGKGMRGAAADTGKYNDKLKNLSDTTGEADSAIKGFGSAVGLVSPKAEKAFFVVGELAGSVEGLSRLLVAGMGPLALVTAAVAALGGMYLKASRDLQAAEEQMQASSEAAAAMAEMFGRLDESIKNARFDLLAAQGKKSAEEIARHTAEMRANAAVSADLKKATEEHADALKKQKEGLKVVAESTIGLSAHQKAGIDGAKRYNKEHGPALQAAVTGAANTVEGLRKKQAELADTYAATIVQNNKNKAATKSSTKVTKETTDAIDELIKTAEGLIPDDRSGIQIMADQIAELQVAADASAPAAARLAPSISALGQAIDQVQADELLAELDKLPTSAAKLDALKERAAELNNVSTPLTRARTLLAELSAEAEKSPQSWEQLAPAIRETQTTLDQLDTAQAKQKLLDLSNQISSIGGNLTQAMSNIAAMNMAGAMKTGQKALEVFDEQAVGLEEQISNIDQQITESTDEATTKQLEAEKLLLEGRLALNEEGREKQKEIENKAIKEAFKLQQAMNIASIAMNTATAIMNVWATIPAPAAPFASAAVAALGTTQAAMVLSQDAPEMHFGGMVRADENMIKARAGEGILTRQGVQAIGGEAGLAAANQGAASGGSIVVQQVYKHRVLDTVLTDSIKRGGPITAELNRRSRRGRRNPHSRAS
tara:strand:+ start:2080 stop:4236 length:2157 start_codon:yes stop_codon:yes gene_type:complete